MSDASAERGSGVPFSSDERGFDADGLILGQLSSTAKADCHDSITTDDDRGFGDRTGASCGRVGVVGGKVGSADGGVGFLGGGAG